MATKKQEDDADAATKAPTFAFHSEPVSGSVITLTFESTAVPEPCVAFCQQCDGRTAGVMTQAVAMTPDGPQPYMALEGRSHCCQAPIRANWPQDDEGNLAAIH